MVVVLTLAIGAQPVVVQAAGGVEGTVFFPDALSLQDFITALPSVPNGQPAGVFVEGVLAMPIVEQPSGQPGFVSSQSGVATHFGLAQQYGSIGLLAHNTLAGAAFSALEAGQTAALIISGNQIQHFKILAIETYQAIEPNNPYSDFLSLEGMRLSAAGLFEHIYAASQGRLVFQTCIAAGGNPSWGRLFVIAEPVPSGLMNTARQVRLGNSSQRAARQ
jgi:hypothetical protein